MLLDQDSLSPNTHLSALVTRMVTKTHAVETVEDLWW